MFYKLHTEISGSGESLVLIHGMGSASSAWKPIRPLLNEFTQLSLSIYLDMERRPTSKASPWILILWRLAYWNN